MTDPIPAPPRRPKSPETRAAEDSVIAFPGTNAQFQAIVLDHYAREANGLVRHVQETRRRVRDAEVA